MLSAINITFLSVDAPVNPPPNFSFKIATSESMVGVFGVSSSSIAGTLEASAAATFVTIASTFAAKPHLGQST